MQKYEASYWCTINIEVWTVLKHRTLSGYKKKLFAIIDCFLTQLGQRQAAAIFRLRTRMLNLKTNFKTNHSSLTCTRCSSNALDNEAHILKCPSFSTQRDKYEITSFDEIYRGTASVDFLSRTAAFLIECDLLPPLW